MVLYTASHSSYRYLKSRWNLFLNWPYSCLNHDFNNKPKLTESELRILKIQKRFVFWKDLFSTSEEIKKSLVSSWTWSTKHELIHATTNGESSSDCVRSLKLTFYTEILNWLEFEWTRMDYGHTKTGKEFEIMRIIMYHSFKVCEFREIISLCDIIPRYLRLQRLFQLYSYTLGYIWIIALRLKKKNKINIKLFLVKVVICWLKWCCKKKMCTVVPKLCIEAFYWKHD